MNYAARVSDSIAAHMEAKNLPNSNCPIGDKVVNLHCFERYLRAIMLVATMVLAR